jgi:hypothetical protein
LHLVHHHHVADMELAHQGGRLGDRRGALGDDHFPVADAPDRHDACLLAVALDTFI